MLEDYTEVLNTGKQLVVGLSKVPEGKYKTPVRGPSNHRVQDPANCRVDVYLVLDPLHPESGFVQHIKYAGFAGAVLPDSLVDIYGYPIDLFTKPSQVLPKKFPKKPLVQIYEAPKANGYENIGPACGILRLYKLLVQPNPKSKELHITYIRDVPIFSDNPKGITDVIDQINTGIHSLI